MCKLIADLVGADRQVVREMVQRLEHASGLPGLDIRLSGEIYGKLHMKMRELGLDPHDTTAHELYKALLNLVDLHDGFLANRLGIDNRHNPDVVLPAVVRVMNHWKLPKTVWSLKPVAIKRLLKANPPKALMKELHYRSLDSMLKREPAEVLLTVARHVESEVWLRRLHESYGKLTASDFEVTEVTIVYLDTQRWQALGQAMARARRSNIMHAAEVGTVIVLPMPAVQLNGLTLTTLLLVLHWVNEIRMYSTYFKFHHMLPNFGKLISKSLSTDTGDHAKLAGQPVHWRVVHRYYGRANRLDHPEIFEPHVQPEDLAYRKAEALLYRVEPALHFWHDLDYVGLTQEDGKPLSFSLLDNALNLLNNVPYEQRFSYHLRDAVWTELYTRYLGQRSLERELLQHLDQQYLGDNLPPNDMEFVW